MVGSRDRRGHGIGDEESAGLAVGGRKRTERLVDMQPANSSDCQSVKRDRTRDIILMASRHMPIREENPRELRRLLPNLRSGNRIA